jgi:hypothetical protein
MTWRSGGVFRRRGLRCPIDERERVHEQDGVHHALGPPHTRMIDQRADAGPEYPSPELVIGDVTMSVAM